MNISNTKIYGISILFIVCIFFPIANNTFSFVNDLENFEKRKSTDKPVFDIEHLDPFPEKYDMYYKDNFNLRLQFIKLYNFLKIYLLNKSPLPEKVIIGNNDWLFNNDNGMDSYRGKDKFTEVELRSFKEELEYRQKFLASINCKLYFMIIPCKEIVYSENIGSNYYRLSKESWGEQLYNYLTRYSSVKPIFVLNALQKNKSLHNVYYKLDTHWNDFGAFSASNEVVKRMANDFPEMKTTQLNDFKLEAKEISNGNIQDMLGDLNLFKDSSFKLTLKTGYLAKDAEKKGYKPVEGFAYPWEFEKSKEISNSKKPKLLIVSDSFGEQIFPFLAEYFSRSVKIFDAWQYKLNKEIVLAEKPDAMLIMIDEPLMKKLLNHQSRLNKK